MMLDAFLSQNVSIDLEVNETGKLYAVGAITGERVYASKKNDKPQRMLQALDAFAQPANYVLGHNLIHHDLPILRGLAPVMTLFDKPVVDTLYLSPLAFPENPYHRLVKDYKLVRDTLNDPVADARLALTLFRDQWESFIRLKETAPEILSIYRYCLDTESIGKGLVAALDAMGAETVNAARVFEILNRQLAGRVCSSRLLSVLMQTLPDPNRRIALAYCVAWLRVAGGNSVLPPWVRRQFPDVAPILRQLRDIPCDKPACHYCRKTHDPVAQLQRYFGFPAFRIEPANKSGGSLQQEIVTAAMGDQPLFAILPTGGGKSLCYQLPALVRYQRRGVLSIVITPLQALMKDQVDNLCRKTGSPNVAALYGLLTPPERGEVLSGIRLGDVALLYVSPEQLRNRSFKEAIGYREIGCWVFDEAHCLSKWGHDFRPDYLYAARFIKEFAQEQHSLLPPVQCFTATAKEDVKAEIIDHFRRELGQELRLFEGGVERGNLHFEVQMVNRAEKLGQIHQVLSERLAKADGGSAVVYCATRRQAEEVAEYLQQQGWPAAAFHAGLEAPIKRHIQENFIQGETRVICATNAFGMGIDKEDVRLVVHADIPGSLENYLQEAGRAGRDRQDADCILLYDENDVESQFKLGSLSELSRKDIAQILRGLRAEKRNPQGEVVLTSGELLRSEQVDASFDNSDRNAPTKVVTALAWLERAGFLQRNQNRTRVFQGRPRVKDLQEAEARIDRLGLSQRQRQRWLAIIDAMINADSDEGFSTDELAEHAAFRRDESNKSNDREQETEAQRVLRTLYDMTASGLIEKRLLLSAYVRYKVKQSSAQLLEQLCALERTLLELLPEQAPDAETGDWQSLSLRQLNQHLCDQGHAESNPEILRRLLQGLSRDGQGLAASRGSLDLRYVGQDQYRVKLQRDWRALRETAERRQAVARQVLACLLEKIPAPTKPSAELLVEFSAEEILEALQRDMLLASQLKDPLAALDRALMFLHELRVITLQQGLAVFHQAMTIRILPEQKGRRYTQGDYEPLSRHYAERVFQVHVINEYARKGLEKMGQALALVLAYFSMDKSAFVARYFPGRETLLGRATGQESYQRIVDDLANPVQQSIVAAEEGANLLVLAGPGSGKTRVVVHRCAYLLRVKRVRPASILILCFNRIAALSLRRRLYQLVGEDARGVTVQTYHGLALRLSGHSLAAQRGEGVDFDGLLREAVALLRGEKHLLGLHADELRERLLAGHRHILVDEYQDIDEDQYALVSALAGRTLSDPDQRLDILAVGDDDQNIYQFRGANLAFIRRFEQDYRARLCYLVDNYRSSGHIIQAANVLIGHNRDRMKTEHPIRINAGRKDLAAGGKWQRLDPLAQGRVQVLQLDDARPQAPALITELQRLKRLDPAMQWSDCAVFAREWSVLDPIRALCEAQDIPVAMLTDKDKLPWPLRIRENRRLLQQLQTCNGELRRADELLELLAQLQNRSRPSPWRRQLQKLLEDWREESQNAELPVKLAAEFVCESLIEQRRELPVSDGVFLSTVHAAKGLEFAHVFVPAGGWDKAAAARQREEERRLYYVAMTRARQTLCLFEAKRNGGFTGELDGQFLLRRQTVIDETLPIDALDKRYAVLGMKDINLGFAGHKGTQNPIHKALSGLEVDDPLTAKQEGERVLLMHQAVPVAMLSKHAAEVWLERMEQIESIRVLAMVQRRREDEGESYRDHCMVPEWEVPMVEIVFRDE